MNDTHEQSGQNDEQKAPADSPNLQDLVSALSFGPGWARGEAPADVRPRHASFEERPRRDRRPPRPGQRDQGAARPAFRNKRHDGKERGEGMSTRRDHGNEPRPERVRLPVEISFIPDRDYLGAVVRQIHGTKRAYPLVHLARLFLVKPEHHMIKVGPRGASSGESAALQFFQDKESKAVFLSESEWLEFVKGRHLGAHFDRVEQVVDAPAGNFTCVGQCKRSGVLLGPPNYHGYSERLLEVHRARFPHVPLDEYRNSIEMVKDPALIDKWKEDAKTQIRYRAKDAGEDSPLLTLAQAEAIFSEKHAAGYRLAGPKVIIPATAFSLIGDDHLKQAIQSARHREDRFPLSLVLALRPAFKHMRLNLFKAGGEETFVSAYAPKPMEAEHVVPEIKAMLDLIGTNPGITRLDIVNRLHPGKNLEDAEVVQSLNPLTWLVDRGHVVEFYNGRLAIPGHWKLPAESVKHPELSSAEPPDAPESGNPASTGSAE